MNETNLNHIENGIEEAHNAIDNINNQLNNLGIYNSYSFSNKTCNANSSNNLITKTLEKGVYIVQYLWTYEGINLRYHCSFTGGSYSGYDNAGVVSFNSTALVNITNDTGDINLELWPSDKTISVSGVVRILKIL